MPNAADLACHRTSGAGPAVVFLPGYASDMSGTKAVALETWAKATGRAFLRFDYRGCGESPGAFETFTLADWYDDVLAMLDTIATVFGPRLSSSRICLRVGSPMAWNGSGGAMTFL